MQVHTNWVQSSLKMENQYYAQEADDLPEDAYPLSYELLGKHQTKDKAILTETKKSNSKYAIKTYTGGGKS